MRAAEPMNRQVDTTRRRALRLGLGLGAAGAVAGLGLAACAGTSSSTTAQEQHVKMTVKRFEFSQKEIRVKKGVPVVVEIVSEDVPHGFSVPQFHARAEVVMPGKPTEVRFVPDRLSTRYAYRDSPYFFASDSTYAVFRTDPERYAIHRP